MKAQLIVLTVWMFGLLNAWGDWLGALAGRRGRTVLAWLSLGSVYFAFKYSPQEVLAIVAQPFKGLVNTLVSSIENLAPATTTTTTTIAL